MQMCEDMRERGGEGREEPCGHLCPNVCRRPLRFPTKIFDVKLQFLMDTMKDGWLWDRLGLRKYWAEPARADAFFQALLPLFSLQYCAFPTPSLQAKTQKEPEQQPCIVINHASFSCRALAGFAFVCCLPSFPILRSSPRFEPFTRQSPLCPLPPTAIWLSAASSSLPPQCAPSRSRWRTRVCPKSCSCRASLALTTRAMPSRRPISG